MTDLIIYYKFKKVKNEYLLLFRLMKSSMMYRVTLVGLSLERIS